MRIFAKLVCLLFFVSVGIGLGLIGEAGVGSMPALGAVGGVLVGLGLGSLVIR